MIPLTAHERGLMQRMPLFVAARLSRTLNAAERRDQHLIVALVARRMVRTKINIDTRIAEIVPTEAGYAALRAG